MAQTVADFLVSALEQAGVRQIFGLIGDSLNGLGDAVRRSRIEWVGVRHEEGAALAAAGQAKLTGQLAVCCGTTGPGSTHLVSGLYEASRDHAPVLAISGDMPRLHLGTDYIQTTKPDLLFRDVALYTETVAAPAQAAKVIHQAIASAYAGRGVAHLTIPQDVMNAAVKGKPLSPATLRPRGEITPQEADLAEIARRIDQAGSVAIMFGAGGRGAADELRALSDHLKAPLIHSVKGKDILPYDDPRSLGGIGMIGTRASYLAAHRCDLFLMVGTDYPYSEFLPGDGKTAQIDERAEALGRRVPTACAAQGSARPALRRLLKLTQAKSDSKFLDWATREKAGWDRMIDRQADPARSRDKIHPQAVARMAGELADPDAVFVIDTGINTLWSGNWIRQTGSQRIIGSFNNAGVGTALGQANGVQALDRSRQVIAMCGDGGFNMLMGEFMTAVHHELPVKVVIYNNSALGLITLEAEQFALPPFREAIEFPNPDFAALARACGAHGFTARKPEDLKDAMAQAFAVKGPAIVDAVVAAHELPNLPHLEIETLENVAVAKVKEAVLAVTGG
jgi:thiamine pyrophosphate-dependent acetolactate synthase large subunit-like protein